MELKKLLQLRRAHMSMDGRANHKNSSMENRKVQRIKGVLRKLKRSRQSAWQHGQSGATDKKYCLNCSLVI